MKNFIPHLKKHILRGAISLIPLGLTILIVRFLYIAIDRRIVGYIDNYLGFSIPGIGILILLVSLYLVGIIASNVVGRQMFSLIEKITSKLPIIKTTYHVGKQLSSTLSLPERQVFQKAVLVEYLKPGIWTIGFVTGFISDLQNISEKLVKVYIPTPPNPTSGTMVIAKESMLRNPGWTVEEAMRAVISGGIIGPNEIKEGENKE